MRRIFTVSNEERRLGRAPNDVASLTASSPLNSTTTLKSIVAVDVDEAHWIERCQSRVRESTHELLW